MTGLPSVTQPPLLWDQHCCPPLSADADLGELARYRRPGGSVVSVNVGYTPQSAQDVLELLAAFRTAVQRDDRLRLVDGVEDADSVRSDGTVAVVFDLEDSAPLDGSLTWLQPFHELGVRTLGPIFNHGNAVGSGCLDATDSGVTRYGRSLVAELNRTGMTLDASHCGRRTALELSGLSAAPMIYSHTGMQAVWDHPHNITDEQARECAGNGGVIGISGVGVFLGANDASASAMLRHIDHAVDITGPEHVGLATDYPFDVDGFNAEMAEDPSLFPPSYSQWGPVRFVPPEGLIGMENALLERGYSRLEAASILGGNFRRVAAQTWRPAG